MTDSPHAESARLVGTLRLVDMAALGKLYSQNLVRRLLFVATPDSPPLASTFELQIRVDDRVMRLTAAVRFVADARTPRGPGCGLEITESRELVASRVREILGTLPPEADAKAQDADRTPLTITFDRSLSALGGSSQGRRTEPLQALVVEDDADLQGVYARMLMPAGFDVIAARDGLEAVEKFGQHHFSLLVVDYLLPKQDGLKVIEQVLAVRSVPIIFASAVIRDPKVAQRLRSLGVQWILEKPFRLDTLRKVFDQAIHTAMQASG